jgi:hypothetical protein
LARLAELMSVEWDMHKPPGAKRPVDWPLARALARISDSRLTDGDVEELIKNPDPHAVVHRSTELTFDDQIRDAEKSIDTFLADKTKEEGV